MKTLKHFVSGVAFLASVALSAGIGQAAPVLIEEWSFTVKNAWDPASTTWSPQGQVPVDSPFRTGNTLPDGTVQGAPGASYSYIQWGTPAGSGSKSFLGADTDLTVTGLKTNDPNGVQGSRYYHGNYQVLGVQNGGAERVLRSTDLVTTIEVSATLPASSSPITFERTYTIKFTETLNDRLLDQCPGYPWSGAPESGITPCPDQLTIELADLKFSTGVIDGYIYDFVVSFDPLTFENIAGLTTNPDGTVSIWTNENVLSIIGTRVIVTARVDEPATLALLGGSLLVGGLMIRRRQRA